MTWQGRIQGGVVVLDEPTTLAEGTRVAIAPLTNGQAPSWAEVLKDVIGKAEGLPSDSSRNHDHYLYGTDKE